jgi:hypothetical protein
MTFRGPRACNMGTMFADDLCGPILCGPFCSHKDTRNTHAMMHSAVQRFRSSRSSLDEARSPETWTAYGRTSANQPGIGRRDLDSCSVLSCAVDIDVVAASSLLGDVEKLWTFLCPVACSTSLVGSGRRCPRALPPITGNSQSAYRMK